MKHTPTPWILYDIPGFIMHRNKQIIIADTMRSNTIKEVAEANAAIIVKAVNNHEKLVECLTKLIKACEDCESFNFEHPAYQNADTLLTTINP